ncbi:transmembrane and coiled-coil domains protein 1 isoform X2 [Hyla sarda]|uniref:transmembrane and coiled-coil domains protein 1 isoform X2 n=1 Tax=Hyla sarda TaxID=327740 RepID=UPI0024C3F755|nr:transmembrane and coiled-coil domains protein 1 isoform X2 [Hyla sarda]
MEAPGSDSLCDDTDPGGNECRRLVDGEQKASRGSHFDNINVIGHGLKHLFQHQRRRSSVSPHDVQQAQPELEAEVDHSQGQDSDGSSQPTALNRVLQQIRAPPKVRRGSSLQQNKKGKTRGSPQIGRRSAQDIMAVLSHPGRPRSSSTTDAHTASVALEIYSPSYLSREESAEKLDRLEGGGLSQASSMVSSGTDGMLAADTIDGTPDPQRTKAAILHLQQKILRLTEQIKIEQTARDDNVAEYLKLANNADRQQGARIKQVFEKKNQKSSQNILHLQKKLEHYHRKLREVEQNGIARQPKDVLRDMHQGLKDVGARVTGFSEGVVDSVKGGLSSFSQATHSAAGAVVSKPREIASLLRNRFGSSDNISSLDESGGLSSTQGEDGLQQGKSLAPMNMFQASPKYGSEEDCSSATSGSLGGNSTSGGPGGGGGGSSRTNTLDMHGLMGFEVVIQEIQEMRETQNQLEESLEGLRTQYQSEYSFILQSLQEERCERLEEQLNDLTELHQNEILNLKQELASMEEKIAYQSYERARDIQEALEACQTRISKMELQQQQQQVVQLEGLENATARNLLGKLINILLALMAVVLVFVSTVANCVVPLLKTRGRTLGTLLLVLLTALLYKHSDSFSGYLERLLSPPR